MDRAVIPEYLESSDEDLHEIVLLLPTRCLQPRLDAFNYYSDTEFIMRYRFNKYTIQFILSLIYNKIVRTTSRGTPLSPMDQLLLALRFYATGSFQVVIGDLIKVHKSTVCRVIRSISHLLASLSQKFICMPENALDVANIKSEFYKLQKFPNVIGCIDCTHIRIQSPGGIHSELWRNRKGFFSVNVQAVTSPSLEFMDITARWRGSVHDSTIFRGSKIHADFENNKYPNCYLLGDNGYPCLRYLLTPLLETNTRAEIRYNKSHIRTRNTVERMFGVWKRRFPCLSVGLRTKVKTTLSIIVATAVLHNIASKQNDVLPDIDEEGIMHFPDEVLEEIGEINETAVRNSLINTVFA